MEYIANFIFFVLSCIYTTLPAIFANMAPVFVKNIRFLEYPLDFNKTFRGKPLLGQNKTIRGLVSAVIFSVTIINLQYLFYKLTGFQLTIYDFDDINFSMLGFLMGFGVIMGDGIKSFFKRQLEIPPGKSFIPWDQIDCALGGLLMGRIVWDFPIAYGITTVVTTFCLHILIRYAAFYMGITDSKW